MSIEDALSRKTRAAVEEVVGEFWLGGVLHYFVLRRALAVLSTAIGYSRLQGKCAYLVLSTRNLKGSAHSLQLALS